MALILIGIPGILKAQLPASFREMEDLRYRSESEILPESHLLELIEAGEAFLDLNNASPEELEASQLFTPYQLHKLIKYREEFGELFSIHELAVIPGFRQSKVKEISSLVFLGPKKPPRSKTKAKHTILLNLGQSLPGREPFRVDSQCPGQNNYAGSPLRACLRIKSRPSAKLSLALTYEKDAGEPFFYNKRPQFLSGYLSLDGKGLCKQLVLGSFKLNQGVGLVNGDGFFHQPGNLRISPQSLSRLRPYASKTESNFEQGIACRFALHRFKLLLWVSYRSLSLSPQAFTKNPEADHWLDFQRTSGLYRTPGELEGRALVSRIHAGIQLLYIHRRLSLGILSGSEWLYPTRQGMKSLDTIPGTVLHHKASIQGNWHKDKLQVFGEIAMNGQASLATLLGTSYHFSDLIQGRIILHHYGTEYRGFYPSSYASGSSIKNEQGAAFHLHVETGKFVNVVLTGALFRYLAPRYLCEIPSSGNSLDLSLQNPGKQQIQWRLRMVSKQWQTTPASEGNKLRPLQNLRVSRIEGQLQYNCRDHFTWQSRLVLSYFSQQEEASPAYALLQQLSLSPSSKLKATVQWVQFGITDWENRIYLYEPGFYYSFSFPAYYGKGQKTTVLVLWKPLSRISFSVKVSGVSKVDRSTWEASLQLQWKI